MALVFRSRCSGAHHRVDPPPAGDGGPEIHEGGDPLLYGDQERTFRRRTRPSIGGRMKRIGALVAAVGLLLAACGGEAGPDPQAEPKEALVSAFENLANSEGTEIVLSLDATAEALAGLSGEGGSPMDEEKIGR